jgi:hypothetical protein
VAEGTGCEEGDEDGEQGGGFCGEAKGEGRELGGGARVEAGWSQWVHDAEWWLDAVVKGILVVICSVTLALVLMLWYYSPHWRNSVV